MNHWLCAECRADYRDNVLRLDIGDEGLIRTLRAVRLYRRLPMWKKLYLTPLFIASNAASKMLLGKSLLLLETRAYVDIAKHGQPYYIPLPATLPRYLHALWCCLYVNGLLRYN